MATITWQNVNAVPNYEGASLLKTSADLANLSFNQLGSALDKGAAMVGEHVEDKLNEEILNLQQGQKTAATNYRSAISELNQFAGIRGINSKTGTVDLASDAEILSGYPGDPNNQAEMKLYLETEKAKAASAAAKFMSTDFGIMTDEQYNDMIAKTGLSIGKKPEEVKMLQEAYALDHNKGHEMSEADKMALAATQAQGQVVLSIMDNNYQAKRAEMQNPIDIWNKEMDPLKNQSLDEFAKDFLGNLKKWDRTDMQDAVSNIRAVGKEVAQQLLESNPEQYAELLGAKQDNGKWVIPGEVPDYILSAAMKKTQYGEDGAWGWLLNFTGQNQQVRGDQITEYKHSVAAQLAKVKGMQDQEYRVKDLDNSYLDKQNKANEQILYKLAREQSRLESQNLSIDPRLLQENRPKR